MNVMLQYLLSMSHDNQFFQLVENFFFRIALCFPLIFRSLIPLCLTYKYNFSYYNDYYGKLEYWLEGFEGVLPDSEYLYVGVHVGIFLFVFTLVLVLEKLNQRGIVRGETSPNNKEKKGASTMLKEVTDAFSKD